MIRKEIYRIMIKQKILFVMIFFLLIKIISFSELDYAYSWKSDSETEFYNEYMTEIAGKTSEWKIEKIKNDYNSEEMRANHYGVMEQIYADYLYVLQDADNHYFLADDGLELSMLHLETDWLLVFLIILIAVNLVSKEYTTKVIQITQTSLKGRKSLAVKKAIIMIGMVTFIASIYQLVYILVCIVNYGFSSANAPIQSIQAFESLGKEMTLIQAYIYVSVLRVMAYTIFGILMFSIANICTKPTTLFFIGISMIFFPIYMMNGNYHQESIYKTIIPIGNLNGYGFLLGNIKFISETDYYFIEIGFRETFCIYFVQILIAALAMIIAIIKFSGYKIKFSKWKSILGVMLVLTCCGCTSGEYKKIEAESMSGRENVTKRYVKINENSYYDKMDKMVYSIAETVIDEERILAIGDSYIMVARKEVNGIQKADFTIEMLDTKSRNRYTLINFGENVDNKAFLGIDKAIDISYLTKNDEAIVNMGINESVVFEDNNIYFSYDNVVVKVDCSCKEYSIIYYASQMENTTISKGQIYYMDGLGQLLRYDIEKDELSVILEDIKQFWVSDQKIYIINKDENGLYFIERKSDLSAQPIKLSDLTPEYVYEDDNIVVYQCGENITYVDFNENNYSQKSIKITGIIAGILEETIYLYSFDEDKINILEYEIK